MTAWSHTVLTSYENCPKRHYHTRVVKDVSDPPGEAAMWGQRVHKALEDRAASGTPLPPTLAPYEAMLSKIEQSAVDGELLVERKLSINQAFQPCGWFDADVWCRGVVDIGVVTGKRAVLLDWKTGKRKPDNDQLLLFALLGFAHLPTVDNITTGFIWLKDKKTDQDTFARSDVPELWQTFLPRVARLDRAHKLQQWPAKPSGLCNGWCPVRTCDFYRKR